MAGKTNYNQKSLRNLKSPPEMLTHDQLVEAGRKGGLKKAENIAKMRLYRDIINTVGAKKLSKPKAKALLELCGIDGIDPAEITANVAVILQQIRKATDDGDTDAARFLRDTSGQAPTQAVQIGPLDAQSVDMASLSDEQIAAQIAELEDGSGTFDGSFDGNSGD